jgi:hypothetical protein
LHTPPVRPLRPALEPTLGTPPSSPRRFGGPGIKKKACLARICQRESDGAASDDDEGTVQLDVPVSAHSPERARRFTTETDDASDDAKDEEGSHPLSRKGSAPTSHAGGSSEPSLTPSPAQRPCSPPVRQPLSLLDTDGGANGKADQLDVLSAMASQLTG